jgi:hypothetical protein
MGGELLIADVGLLIERWRPSDGSHGIIAPGALVIN